MITTVSLARSLPLAKYKIFLWKWGGPGRWPMKSFQAMKNSYSKKWQRSERHKWNIALPLLCMLQQHIVSTDFQDICYWAVWGKVIFVRWKTQSKHCHSSSLQFWESLRENSRTLEIFSRFPSSMQQRIIIHVRKLPNIKERITRRNSTHTGPQKLPVQPASC